MPDDIAVAESFPMLIRRLTVKHHAVRGLQEMEERTGIPYATLWRWDRGSVRMPEYQLIQRLADTYGLDVDRIMQLAHRDFLRFQRREPIPVPLQNRKPGPNPRPDSVRSRRRRRGAAVLLVAFTSFATALGAAAPAQALALDPDQNALRLIGSRRRRRDAVAA